MITERVWYIWVKMMRRRLVSHISISADLNFKLIKHVAIKIYIHTYMISTKDALRDV